MSGGAFFCLKVENGKQRRRNLQQVFGNGSCAAVRNFHNQPTTTGQAGEDLLFSPDWCGAGKENPFLRPEPERIRGAKQLSGSWSLTKRKGFSDATSLKPFHECFFKRGTNPTRRKPLNSTPRAPNRPAPSSISCTTKEARLASPNCD